jgi:dienelactone hydrolase
MRTRILGGVLLVLLAAAGWLVLGQYTRAASLVVLGAGIDGWPRRLAGMYARPVAERELAIPTRNGVLRGRAYVPQGRVRQTAVLITGVHPAGIDDPRLRDFARSLAAVGLGIITPELPPLVRFEITPAATDGIEDVATWTAAERILGGTGRVGLIGISFSGGLSIVAAGREPLRDRVAFVLSVGGHGDLLRALEAVGGGVLAGEPDARADPFGLAVVLASVAERVVPPEQVGPLRNWALAFLEAAHLSAADWEHAEQLYARAEGLAADLPEPAATLVRHVRAADSAALRPRLLDHVYEFATAPALSPERAPPPRAPVYLLHGSEDDVIPPNESQQLARHLRPGTPVRLLVTPVLAHADLAEPTATEVGELVSFFASLLRR